LAQADGRYAQLSVIYPCFLASRMLGSAGFPWFHGATAPFQNENSLTIAYIGAGLALSIVAFDYQVCHNISKATFRYATTSGV